MDSPGARRRVALAIAALVVSGVAAVIVAGRRDRPPTVVAQTRPAVQASPVPPPVWTTTTAVLTVGGRQRSYLLVRPPARPNVGLPVVVVLHGRTATPQIERNRTRFPEAMGAAVYVYPAGFEESWNAGSCCAGAQAAGVDDVTFVSDVVHQVLASQPDANVHRVLLVGFSNGGRMAYRLTCARPTMFAAFAVIGAVPVSDCPHRPALPFTDISFEHDPVVPLAATNAEVEVQRVANQCAGPGTTAVHGAVAVTTWSSCASRAPVELALYPGAEHIWPSGGLGTPSAEQLVTQFFRGLRAPAPVRTRSRA